MGDHQQQQRRHRHHHQQQQQQRPITFTIITGIMAWQSVRCRKGLPRDLPASSCYMAIWEESLGTPRLLASYC